MEYKNVVGAMYVVLILILISAIAILIHLIREQKKKLEGGKLASSLRANTDQSMETTSNQALNQVYTIESNMSHPCQSQTNRYFQSTTTIKMDSANRNSDYLQNVNPFTICENQSDVNFNQRRRNRHSNRIQQQIDNSLLSSNEYESNSNCTAPSAPPLICSQTSLNADAKLNLDIPPPYPGTSTSV